MSPARVTPGALRRRILVEAPADVDDGAGGVTRGYAPPTPCFASVEPLGADEATAGAALGLKRLWRVTLRSRAGVGGGCRVVWRAKTFDVLSVRALDADGRFDELLCEEIAP